MPYTHHVFCCTNQRPAGSLRGCCADKQAESLRSYMKQRVSELGIAGVRINAAGCLGECDAGPVMVVYPEGVWYRCDSREAIDEVIVRHLQAGVPVAERMLTPRP